MNNFFRNHFTEDAYYCYKLNNLIKQKNYYQLSNRTLYSALVFYNIETIFFKSCVKNTLAQKLPKKISERQYNIHYTIKENKDPYPVE